MIQQVAEFLFTKAQKKKRKKGRYIVMIIIGRKGKAMGEMLRKFEFRNGGIDRWIGVKKIKERERERVSEKNETAEEKVRDMNVMADSGITCAAAHLN